ncbi:class I SAM-dependent methyltransferase [Desulfobacter curvatus]|uniref:class I SAM-dependent methyltransferase n=1 Tax=Desulfobacter curvatus TaxID=2290 RepID=UPI0003730FB7|nr:class I SAM-dependent methyltransferase [Desulfobacter curvatus]
MEHSLSGIPETLLVALWARAAETRMPNPLIRDEKAVEMVGQIDYDFSRFEKGGKLTQTGVAIRTQILDTALLKYLSIHPDAVVINLGAGLDTRHTRLDCRNHDWYEIDLPESITLRRHFFKESESYRFIEKSIFDLSWIQDVNVGDRPVLFLAEGLLMYFEESLVQNFFKELATTFRRGRVLFETLPPIMVGKSKHHCSLKKMDSRAEFKWGLKNPLALEAWHPAIRLLDAWDYSDYCKRRWGIFGVIARLPFVRPNLACRIVYLSF